MMEPTIAGRNHSSQTASPLQAKNRRIPGLPESARLMALVAAFAMLAFLLRNPFVGQWDSFDYVTKTVRHDVSDLAFGRPMLVATTIAAWDVAHRLGATVTDAPAVAQGVVLTFGVSGLMAFYFCLKPLGGKALALWGVAWLATTPMYLAYSGMVMTEVPAIACLLTSVALLLRWEETQRHRDLLLSALAFAVGILMREQLITAAAVFVFLIPVNRRLKWSEKWSFIVVQGSVTVLAVVAVLVFLWRIDPAYWHRVQRWLSVIQWRHTGFLKQFYYVMIFAAANSLVALVMTVATWRHWARVIHVRAIFAGMGCLPLIVLLSNSDLGIQPRYELMAVPAIIIAALVGLKIEIAYRRPASQKAVVLSVAVAQLFFFLAGLAVQVRHNRLAEARKARTQQLLAMAPQNAAFVGGAYTPVLEFYRQTGIRPNWFVIRSGWEWKENNLAEEVKQQLQDGRPVYFLSGEKVWDYLRAELADVNALRSQFRFVQLEKGLEQIELTG